MIEPSALATSSSSLCLNIVAIPPRQSQPKKGKKRKLNKYDKKRQKARRPESKKQLQVQVDSGIVEPPLVPESGGEPGNPLKAENRELDAEPDVKGMVAHERGEASDNGNAECGSEEKEYSEVPCDAASETAEGENDSASESDDKGDKGSSPLDPLQDTEHRAKYLAEFHARPLELDRRAGVSKNRGMAKSKESSHLFAQDLEWTDLPLHERLIASLVQHFRHSRPTVVQSKTVLAFASPLSSSQPGEANASPLHNLLIKAETGSGKTLAYLLPILHRLAFDERTQRPKRVDRGQSGTRCILLCPTRELASQTFSVAEQLCSSSFNWIVPGCLFGEERRKSEKARLRKGLSVIVATPGRLLDHLVRTESLLLNLKGKLEWLVLDEADRLLDMGLGDQVQQIVQRIRANQPGSGRNGVTWRSVLVSATVSPHVEKLAKETLIGGDNSWVWVQGGDGTGKQNNDTMNEAEQACNMSRSAEFAEATPHQLTHLHMTVSAKLRLPALIAFLIVRAKKKERTVVFMSTCASVDFYYALFAAMGSMVPDRAESEDTQAPGSGLLGQQCYFYKLHGSVPHGERQQTLRQFVKVSAVKKQAAILFATDVASRGLNLPDIDWTVQYDPPGEVAEYVHRAGRVARAGKAGHSLLFLLPSERPLLDILKKRGVRGMSPLSLTSTLISAAEACKNITTEGVRHAGGRASPGSAPAHRSGEAFAAEVQRRVEEFVAADDLNAREREKTSRKQRRVSSAPSVAATSSGLMELARNAFISHIRAYPTKEKLVRHVFSAKALHLGHVARSFALKEAPRKLATMASKQTAVVIEKTESRKRNNVMAFRSVKDMLNVSHEYPPSKKPNNSNPPSSKALFLSNAANFKASGLDGL
jgi:ATP-dependent RNA helicase DDX31/DBP7